MLTSKKKPKHMWGKMALYSARVTGVMLGCQIHTSVLRSAREQCASPPHSAAQSALLSTEVCSVLKTSVNACRAFKAVDPFLISLQNHKHFILFYTF